MKLLSETQSICIKCMEHRWEKICHCYTCPKGLKERKFKNRKLNKDTFT